MSSLDLKTTAVGTNGKSKFSEARFVLVTGGAGFIGSNLANALIDQGLRVRVLDNFSTGKRSQLNHQAELFEADIKDLDAIRPAFAGVDCVFHTAALPRVPLSIEKPVETHMVNVVGTLNVLLAARDARVRRVIYSGSSSAYGDQPRLPLREDMPPNPLNPYALQKLTGEYYTRLFHRLFSMQTLTLRYFNVYGPGMADEGAYVTVISVFRRARREGKPLTIEGDGEQTRDFTHVSDVVHANLLAMDCEIADGRAINVGGGRNISINRVAELVGGPQINLPPRPGDARHTLADTAEAQRTLGWKPQARFEDGLAELLRTSS
jgi:nucleoside-diphosphate-sugar epimerase